MLTHFSKEITTEIFSTKQYMKLSDRRIIRIIVITQNVNTLIDELFGGNQAGEPKFT
jgi:hypothetical protein